MWKKIKLLRQYDPFITGWVDTWIFATFMFILGVFAAKQDPMGTFMVCYLGIGCMCGVVMGGSYNCYKTDWINQCPYTNETLKKWRWAAESLVKDGEKMLSWEETNRLALQLKRTFDGIPYEYAFAAIITAHIRATTDKWISKEAKAFRWENPKIWHIMDYV